MKQINYLLFIGIIILAFLFRFFQVATVPSSPTLDEVSIGYNSYSILKTGADEFGHKFPILLRAYDDYRPALYVYLVIPFILAFDLSVFSVRFPSVILSTFSVLSLFFIAQEFISKKNKHRIQVSLFVMFLGAVSPWSVYISRLGHEANAAFSFFIFGLLFFLGFINSKRLRHVSLLLASIFFALSFSSYQSQKLFIPLFVLLLCVLYFKKLLDSKKVAIVSLLLGALISLPIVVSSFSPDALIRFSGTNVFKSNHPVLQESIKRIELHNGQENLLQKLFDNRRVGIFLVFYQAFLSHTNPLWYLANTGGENFKAPDFGLLTFPEAFLIVLGVIYLVRTDTFPKRHKILFLGWFVFSILPAAITTDYPHAMRSMTILFLPQIIAGLGLLLLLNNARGKKLLWGVIFFVFTVSTIWFYHAYFVNFKNEESYRFQYGVINALTFAQKNEKEFDEIVISNQGVLRASYMYYLFNSKFDPSLYQKSGQNENGRFDTERVIGKYIFTDPSKKEILGSPLFVIPANSQPKENFSILEEIKYLDGRESIWVAGRR